MDVFWDLLSLQDTQGGNSVGAQTSEKTRVVNMGRSIREFALVEPLGTGGYGTVWLARRRRTGDLVAVKVLSKKDPKKDGLTKGYLSRMDSSSSARTEKTILACADCPYVVKLFFSFATAKHSYLVMEYLPGGDCFTLLQKFGFLEQSVAELVCA